jgi:S1-C subfamily serine protease
VVGSFPPDDLAVVHVDGTPRAAQFADSSKLAVGEIVLAVGNPLGLESSVTQGIVSALGRTSTEETGATLAGLIQTSASINPGNSGGALVDLEGHVVGIPTLAAADPQLGGGAAPGIGFAIPSNLVRRIASQLVRYGHVVESGRAYLGIQIGDTGGAGVYVGSVQGGQPAAKAGMSVGDIIVAVAGKPTPTTSALGDVLAGLRPGRRVKVVVERQGGGRKTLEVTLGQYPGGG